MRVQEPKTLEEVREYLGSDPEIIQEGLAVAREARASGLTRQEAVIVGVAAGQNAFVSSPNDPAYYQEAWAEFWQRCLEEVYGVEVPGGEA